MSTQSSTFVEAKAALLAIAVEANELQQAVGGSVTEAVAGWLAPQYALAAREQLADLKGEERLKLLRAFVQDWALLRHGDQTAERLRIEREWLELASRDADMKWKRKIITGLETLTKYAAKHPKAQAALAELARQVRHPFDPSEKMPQWNDRRNEPIRPNPTESDR
jgi:hypothetical protein